MTHEAEQRLRDGLRYECVETINSVVAQIKRGEMAPTQDECQFTIRFAPHFAAALYQEHLANHPPRPWWKFWGRR